MTEVTSDIKVSQQLDYKKSKLMHPTYSMTRVYPITGSTSQTLNTSAGISNWYKKSLSVPDIRSLELI